MTVSFVVIAYNEERNIERTLRSILAQEEMPADYEIVVVNDGSQDRTLQIVAGLRETHPAITIVDLQPNQGRGAARAAGVAAAKGRYMAFVDADITLPVHWLKTCMPYMQDYDACGGIAVPDGDVAFVHQLLALEPKVTAHSTTVTGSNGLFKREVFEKISFNPKKRNGEDVDLGYKIAAAKLRTIAIDDLLVAHIEAKSYGESLAWLFESGIGATRQFYEHREVRLPDLAFAAFMGVLLVSVLAAVFIPGLWLLSLLAVPAFLSLSSVMHLRGKFHLFQKPLRGIAAVLVNDSLLFAYYCGRAVGTATEWRKM